ncbi:hypothetical protein NDU88_005223 [Pleurodeles waltl]|uniref:Uncharacterized protein n=1 Tax=Pleurodeles waltl TaxID=8319 RepID=A0AAV7VM50_PLEWA|nr:hypothetical protein NDU88_005223 [Pleurodeles waltl]
MWKGSQHWINGTSTTKTKVDVSQCFKDYSHGSKQAKARSEVQASDIGSYGLRSKLSRIRSGLWLCPAQAERLRERQSVSAAVGLAGRRVCLQSRWFRARHRRPPQPRPGSLKEERRQHRGSQPGRSGDLRPYRALPTPLTQAQRWRSAGRVDEVTVTRSVDHSRCRGSSTPRKAALS